MFPCLRQLIYQSPRRYISYLSDSNDTILSQLHAWNINHKTYLELMKKKKKKEDQEKDLELMKKDEIEYLTCMALRHAINN
tara:strand:+ start:39 stop:281 length:243 start_codon:yes stop_codon:yes gene_type:complete